MDDRIREKLREFLLECYGEDINEATGRKISVEGNCEGTEQLQWKNTCLQIINGCKVRRKLRK